MKSNSSASLSRMSLKNFNLAISLPGYEQTEPILIKIDPDAEERFKFFADEEPESEL